MTAPDNSAPALAGVPAPAHDARLSPWAPLRHRVFLALFIAQMASNIGTLMQSVGSAWLMGDLGATRTFVALVQTATFLPVFVFGIPGGALADIIDRRRLLLVTQTWMMLAALGLTVLSFAHRVTPAYLLALTFALGIGAAVNGPAWMAIQPDLVPKREFSQAMALGALTYNVGRAIGPALGGLILAALGAPWVFAVNALSFTGTVVVLARWRRPFVPTRLPAETLAGATRAALRYGINAPLLRTVLVRVAALVLPAAALQALLPIVVRDSLRLSSGAYGILLGCFGVGAACAAVLRPRFEERWSPDRLIVAATLVMAAGTVVDGYVTQPVLVGIALAITGLAWTTAFTTVNVAAQATLAAWVRARGMGIYMLVLAGGLAVGSAAWGLVADWSVTGAHVIAALLLVAGLLLVRRFRLDHTVGMDLTAGPGVDPVVMLSPRADDGPVMVTVVYRVPEAAMTTFVAEMREIERHRRRTGAFQWGLFRDLAVPDRFVETFHVDSWAEHLRQHERNTVSGSTRRDAMRRYVDPGTEITHLVSAYSAGALDPVALGEPTFTDEL